MMLAMNWEDYIAFFFILYTLLVFILIGIRKVFIKP
jgi:hypothetical protein